MRRPQSPKPASVTSIGSRLKAIPHARLGWLVGITADGRPLVDFEGNRAGRLPALSTQAITLAECEQAQVCRREVLLVFESGDPLRPIIVGFIAKPATSSSMEATVPSLPEVAEVDGKRVCIEGKDQIVLRCGEASITLDRRGRVVVRGLEVVTEATGVNRVRGGSVQLN